MRTILSVNDNHVVASRSDQDEIRMRHTIMFAADRANLVRLKGHCSIELPNRFNKHVVDILWPSPEIKQAQPAPNSQESANIVKGSVLELINIKGDEAAASR